MITKNELIIVIFCVLSLISISITIVLIKYISLNKRKIYMTTNKLNRFIRRYERMTRNTFINAQIATN